MLVKPRVLGEESLVMQLVLFNKIQFLSKSSMSPFSCNVNISRDILWSHGFPFFKAKPFFFQKINLNKSEKLDDDVSAI
jgi:hypothetical protein